VLRIVLKTNNRARPGGETLDRFCAGKHKTKNNQNNRLQTTITFGTFFVLAQPKPILKTLLVH
jgi:hypothetical protein